MLDLMAVSQDNGRMPHYLHAINRILRELRIEQQETSESFNYAKFKKRTMTSEMSSPTRSTQPTSRYVGDFHAMLPDGDG